MNAGTARDAMEGGALMSANDGRMKTAGLAALVMLGLAAMLMIGANGAGGGQWAAVPVVRSGETVGALFVSPNGVVYSATVDRTERQVMAGRVSAFAEAMRDSDYVEFERLQRLQP